MSEQDTSEDLQVASKQQTNTGRNPSEPATSSNKQGGQSTLLAILGVITFVSWVVYFCTGAERNDPKIHWLPISLMLTIIFVIILFLCKKLWVFKNISQFNSWIFGVTLIGGTIAFLLPLGIANDFTKDGEGTTLRQMLIYTVGGLIGVITLGETRRKNDLEKEKNEQDRLKNNKEHTRQIHAERHSRYTAAIEQLASSKSVIRMGGAYSLIDLMNEWLSDKEIDSDATHATEKNIFENLCAYIRSPFLLNIAGEYTFYISETYHDDHISEEEKIHLVNDKHVLADEANIRESIFSALSNFIKKIEQEPCPDPISLDDLPCNFFNTIFFYNFYDLTLNKTQFSNSHFYDLTYFSNVTFKGDTHFSGAKFHNHIYFDNCIFDGDAFFRNIYFQNPDCFTSVRFNGEVDFAGASFLFPPYFNSAHFAYNEKFDFENYGFNTCRIIIDGEESIIGINTYEVSLKLKNGKVVTASLPQGARLFDPESWNKKHQKYDNESSPAMPPPPSKNINHPVIPPPTPKNTQVIPLKFSSDTNNI